MRDVSVVMAYYENPLMLERQFTNFDRMSQEVKEHLEFVVIDDGSPKHPAQAPFIDGFKIQIHRMGIDIRWNQDACRNLGAREARHKWLLLTDMDHLIPEKTLTWVMEVIALREKSIYKFSRVNDVTFDVYKPHPNSWFMTKEMYFEVGGYDERFAGLYGTDWDFRDRCVRTAEFIEQVPVPLIRVGREHTPDASCPREFGRKSTEDAQAIRRIRDDRGKATPQMFGFPNSMVLRLP